jgi:phenylalanyl-tRNA synthetase beta chain
VAVENPLVSDEGFLRQSLLPGLVQTLARNADRRNGEVRLFEVGTVFSPPDRSREEEGRGNRGAAVNELPTERESLAVVLAGSGDDARAAVAGWRVLADALRLADVSITAAAPGGAPSGLHPTRSARLVARTGIVIGSVGEIDPAVAEGLGAPAQRIGWLEVDLGLLLDPAKTPRRSEYAVPVSRYPSADVDLAFVVADEVPAQQVARSLEAAGGESIEGIELFDVFRGPPVERGHRSLAFHLRFSAVDRTLNDGEVAALRQACIEAAARDGAVLR